LWDGQDARPCIISGLFGPHHKKFWDIFLIGIFRELHKKDYPILWDGQDARPCIISGLFGPHHKKFWDIFLIGSLLVIFR
jgi:hypothetical protein